MGKSENNFDDEKLKNIINDLCELEKDELTEDDQTFISAVLKELVTLKDLLDWLKNI